jgi:uncharacterized protein YkwD
MLIRALGMMISLLIVAQASAAGTYRPSRDAVDAAVIISRFRGEHGLGPVRPDAKLSTMARVQAEAMAAAGIMTHDVAGAFPRRVEKAGLGSVTAAENIAAGFPSLLSVIEGWQKSEGHRDNLLIPAVTRIGIVRVQGHNKAYGTYWALVLAGPDQTITSGQPRALRGGQSVLPWGIGHFIVR